MDWSVMDGRPGRSALAALARAFNVQAKRRGRPLPALLFLTDPVRTPDPAAIALRLPRGTGVVWRHFGASDTWIAGRRLAAICRRRGLTFLIGADWALARRLRADGVHLPERLAGRIKALRARKWIVTAAAHSPLALAQAHARGADAALLSPVFDSASPSAGRPLGPRRAGAMARGAGLRVYALGGVDARSARGLRGRGFSGLAAIAGLALRGD